MCVINVTFLHVYYMKQCIFIVCFIIIQSVIWPGLSLTSLIIITKGFVKNQETNNTIVVIGGY